MSFSIRKAPSELPSPSEKTLKSGAEDSHERHGSSVMGANMDKCDPGEENCWSDSVTAESQADNGPVGGVSMRTGAGEANDGTFRSPEVVRLAAVCSTASVRGGEAEGFEVDWGVDAEGSGVSKCWRTIFGETSMLSCIASVRVEPGMLDEVEGTRRLSGVV